MKTRALIVGAGGVLGRALREEFAAAGYEVIALRRANCDLHDPARVHDTVTRVIREHGPLDVLVHGAAHFVVGSFAELSLADLDDAWRVGAAGAAAAAKAALPSMVTRGRGTLLFTGATASLRGSARFAALAAAKFALRGMAQALAREYQPQGIHVAHVVIDGLLKGSPSIARFNGSNEKAIDPADAARAYRWLAEQRPSAWTHEIDLRPNQERF